MNLGSTLYQNDSGTVREWAVAEAVRGTKRDTDAETGAFWYLVLECETSPVRVVVREGDLHSRLSDPDCETWQQYDPRKRGSGVIEADPSDPYGPLRGQASPDSPTDLHFERLSGEGSRTEVNQFLTHPALVSHGLGRVQFHTDLFVARSPYDDSVVAAVVLHRPAARALDTADRVEVRRLATRVDRPANTASWILSQVRDAVADGYDTIQAYSGFAGNSGVCYDAAGFTPAKTDVVDAEASGWNDADDRNGRVEVQGSWKRTRWEYDL